MNLLWAIAFAILWPAFTVSFLLFTQWANRRERELLRKTEEMLEELCSCEDTTPEQLEQLQIVMGQGLVTFEQAERAIRAIAWPILNPQTDTTIVLGPDGTPLFRAIGDYNCAFNARNSLLRCAVNPGGPCEGCQDFEAKYD